MATMGKEELLSHANPKMAQHAAELYEAVEFMRKKLIESREAMGDMDIVIPYDNGGGQTGIRENPSFNAYEKLLKSYTAALDKLEAMTGAKPEERKAIKVDVLTEFQSKYKRRNA